MKKAPKLQSLFEKNVGFLNVSKPQVQQSQPIILNQMIEKKISILYLERNTQPEAQSTKPVNNFIGSTKIYAGKEEFVMQSQKSKPSQQVYTQKLSLNQQQSNMQVTKSAKISRVQTNSIKSRIDKQDVPTFTILEDPAIFQMKRITQNNYGELIGISNPRPRSPVKQQQKLKTPSECSSQVKQSMQKSVHQQLANIPHRSTDYGDSGSPVSSPVKYQVAIANSNFQRTQPQYPAQNEIQVSDLAATTKYQPVAFSPELQAEPTQKQIIVSPKQFFQDAKNIYQQNQEQYNNVSQLSEILAPEVPPQCPELPPSSPKEASAQNQYTDTRSLPDCCRPILKPGVASQSAILQQNIQQSSEKLSVIFAKPVKPTKPNNTQKSAFNPAEAPNPDLINQIQRRVDLSSQPLKVSALSPELRQLRESINQNALSLSRPAPEKDPAEEFQKLRMLPIANVLVHFTPIVQLLPTLDSKAVKYFTIENFKCLGLNNRIPEFISIDQLEYVGYFLGVTDFAPRYLAFLSALNVESSKQ